MTWLIYALGAAAAGAFFAAGYRMGRAHGRADIDDRSFWAGFADGELHQQLTDRTPSLN